MSGPVDSYRPGGSYEHSSTDRGRASQSYRGQGRGRGGYQQREYNHEQRGSDWEQDVRERRPDRRFQRDPYDSREHSRNAQNHQPFDTNYGSASTSGSAMRVPAAPLHPSLPARPGGSGHYERQQPQQEGARPTPPTDWYSGQSEPAGPPVAASELPQKPRKKIVTPPNQSVILIGIPLPATEEDVKSFIDEFKANAEDPSPVDNVSIVRDKQTGQSKRFGFVRFISLEHARAFVEANFDHVYWRSRGSHDITEDGVKVRLDYATVDRRPGETPRDAKNAPPRESYQPPAFRLNDGSKDMGSSANRILLLRNLDPLTKEYDITRSLEHLDEDMQERVKNAQGPRRVILIKDKETYSSWCFAFALYEDEECAKAAMRTIMDPARFPTGYSIHQRLVAVTFARIGCFAQAYAKTTWSFSDDTLEGKKQEYMYWDDAAYANVYDCANYQEAAKRKQEEAAKENEVDAFFSSLESEHPAPKAEIVQAPPKIDLNTAGVLGPPGGFTKDKKKGATELIISKKIAVDITKWNQKKAEPEMAASTEPPSEAQSNATTSAMKRPNPSEAEEARQDTTDPKLPKCLLCQRQFKSIEVLRKHNDQSSLHKTNLEDQAKVDAARAAVAELAPTDAASQYRDRALERRETYNQPQHPPPPPSKKHKKAPEIKPVSSAPEKHIEESNIGSKLLASMGWTAGAGLGSSQAGRADPIQAKAFVQGAGIGASKGINASDQAGDAWRGSEHGRSKARQRMLEEQSRLH